MFAVQLTETAELRPLEVWHATEFAAHLDRAREHIRPWVGPSFLSEGVPGARATLSRYAEQTARDGARIFGIWHEGVLVGGVMFVDLNAAAGTCELGCWLQPDAEGRGLITLSCRALLDWAFGVRGIHRAEWRCRADNERSADVARRLGMTFEGTLREAWKVGDIFHDKQVWSILRSESVTARG
ncbi:GNAT family N-acetyltransferase [Lacisediminihabitans sp.]|uniref:GNAT family N-acetyltransferase n=1 Tax=Lacisediminihabitans sp. TaxID=2787631 RepID=UPI00374DE343